MTDVLTQNDHARFERLDEGEARRLLGWESIGRLATTAEGEAPEVVPVNYALDGDDVVFRCEPRRAEQLRDRAASFEVDRFDPVQRTGWSVLARGRLEEIPASVELDAAIASWAPGSRHVLMRLRTEHVTGRRIAHRVLFVGDRGLR